MTDPGFQATTQHLNLLDALPVLILDVDRHGNLLFANHKAKQAFGLRDELEEVTLVHLLDSASQGTASRMLEQLFSGEGDVIATWGLNVHGERHLANVNGVTIFENDYAVRARLYVHDLTDRADAATKAISAVPSAGSAPPSEAIHATQEYLNTLLQKSGLLVYVFDQSDKIVEINRRMTELTGHSTENVQSLKELIATLYPGRKDRDAVYMMHNEMYRGKHANARELRVFTRRGEIRHIAWTSGILRDSHGRASAIMVTGIDVTGKKQLERELSVQSTILSRLPETVVVADRRARIIQWLGAGETMFGCSAKQMIGQSAFSIFPAEQRRSIQTALAKGLKLQGRWSATLMMARTDNRPIAIKLEAIWLPDEDGAPEGILLVLQDQTREKQLEAAYRKVKQPAVPQRRGTSSKR